MASLGGRTSSTTPQHPDIPTIDIPESNSTGEPWFLRTLFSAIFSYFWFTNCACVSVYTSCSRGPRGTKSRWSMAGKSDLEKLDGSDAETAHVQASFFTKEERGMLTQTCCPLVAGSMVTSPSQMAHHWVISWSTICGHVTLPNTFIMKWWTYLWYAQNKCLQI